ncbi:M48 family metalloprotease [bacterium]|nr:M48 family metalloprotease [bacterium]
MYWHSHEIQNRVQDQIIIPSKNGYVTIPAPDVRSQRKARQSPSMKSVYWLTSHFRNNAQFVLMLVGMIMMLGFMGYTIAGFTGIIWILVISGFGYLVNRNFSIIQVLRRKKIRSISLDESPVLYIMLERLAQKAGLSKTPSLYLDESPEINAYAIESKDDSAIIISQGILKTLDSREMVGVLAHEVAHLKNKDVQIMLLVEQIRRFTGYMAFIGQVLLVLNLPLLLLNQVIFPWALVIALIASPTISVLFQVAVSRNREFQADLDAVALSEDAVGLASALNKIAIQNKLLKRFYAPNLKEVPDLLRTHPATRQRIQRLEVFQ